MDDLAARVGAIVASYAGREGAALPILHDVQASFGYVPSEAIPIIAHALNRTRAEIHGVVTFYHDFRSEPRARHQFRVCRAEACQAAGSAAVLEGLEQGLGIRLGETTADGTASLEAAYCLGLCSVAPAAMVDGRLVGRLDRASADRLVEGLDR